MDKYLREHFDVPAKNPSEAAQRKWRAAVTIVKNHRRRFRMVPDLDKRKQDETKRRSIQVLRLLFFFVSTFHCLVTASLTIFFILLTYFCVFSQVTDRFFLIFKPKIFLSTQVLLLPLFLTC
jgi:Ca2+-ATPase N terminal autoinhibitory domain